MIIPACRARIRVCGAKVPLQHPDTAWVGSQRRWVSWGLPEAGRRPSASLSGALGPGRHRFRQSPQLGLGACRVPCESYFVAAPQRGGRGPWPRVLLAPP